MEDINLYKFVCKIALEYRLSLENLCRLLGKSTDEKTRMEIYNNIEKIFQHNEEMMNAYKYLFFYETLNESKNMSIIAYTKAVNYIKRYNKIKKEGTKEELQEILRELDKTDLDYERIKSKFPDGIVTEEDIIIISKYRTKYAISRRKISEYLNVSRHTLETMENKIGEGILKQRIKKLSEFLINYEMSRRVKKNK